VASAPTGAERLSGLTIPGLANAHSHAFQRALRGRAHTNGRDFWSWRDGMYELAARLEPDLYRALARATFGEMALAGITCVGEFHYLHHAPGGRPYDDPNEMGRALIQAASEAGIRMTLLDACYLHGGIDREPNEVQRRFSDGDAESWAARVGELSDGPGLRVGAAIHSVRAVDPESAAAVASAAGERPLHAHVSERREENAESLGAWGDSPTVVLERAGALSPRFTAVHFTHPEDGDVARVAAVEAGCCLCPTTERDLGDGIAQAARLRAEGIALALGSDSHAVIDLFEEARAVELDERLESGERGRHAPAELLAAATAAGHSRLGWPDAGRIEAGAIADLVTVGLDSVRLAGAEPASAASAAVFCASAADVRDVIVGGRRVVGGGGRVRGGRGGGVVLDGCRRWAAGGGTDRLAGGGGVADHPGDLLEVPRASGEGGAHQGQGQHGRPRAPTSPGGTARLLGERGAANRLRCLHGALLFRWPCFWETRQ
jgi:formiminoglutamate deiminase